MPEDENRNRADIVIYGNSTINRTNLGRWVEQMVNAAGRDLVHRFYNERGFMKGIKPTEQQIRNAVNDTEWMLEAFRRLKKFYWLTVPMQAQDIEEHPSPATHVAYVLREGIYLHCPPDNAISEMDQLRNIKDSEFCPHYGNVTYTNNVGERVTSDRPALIGEVYMMVLEKTGEDYSAGASVKVQHFGVPAKLSQNDRNTTPAKETSVRGIGESESRALLSTIGQEPVMEMLEQSSSPTIHGEVMRRILTEDRPTHIERIIDRKVFPFGYSRPVNLFKNIFSSRGMRFYYKPENVQGEDQSW